MSVIHAIEQKYKKPKVVDVKSGDTVKVHQKIREGNKERIQVFEGLVIKTARQGSHMSSITVRRIASGVGVEKTYLVHSPLITKVEIVKRSKVRRNYLSYMRERTGKSARLSNVDFDREEVNKVPEPAKEQPKTEKPIAEEESSTDKSSAKQNPDVDKQEAKTEEKPGTERKEEPKSDPSKSNEKTAS